MEMYYVIVGLLTGFLVAAALLLALRNDKTNQDIPDMKCPICQDEARVVDTMRTSVNHVHRRRKCVRCDYAFYTVEVNQGQKCQTPWMGGK